MATVHWLGAGLSSGPGIRRLAQSRPLVIWNRTLAKAESAIRDIDGNAIARRLEWDVLASSLQPGDVIVSMLPATMHPHVASLCLEHKAHFVSSSYLSPELRKLSGAAEEADLCFLNEMGLDPGLDHLLAHALMSEYQSSPVYDKNNQHSFRSYCGGFPKVANAFRYKFSWSPLGVLRALKSKSRWIADGQTRTGETPWTTLSVYRAHLPEGEETFQSFPNRDSLPFMTEYGFANDWNIREFVRGTLRYDGWSEAWSDIFALVESATGDDGERRLMEKSDELWQSYQYDEGEADRVVLIVELEVRLPAGQGGDVIWHRLYTLDEAGDERGSAMSRLVSLPVSLGVDAVLDGRIANGVTPAPRDAALVNEWLEQLIDIGEGIRKITLK